jgi:Protein of unknown function (DUF3429)
MMNDSKRRVAQWLGYAGLIPFFACACLLVYATYGGDLSEQSTAARDELGTMVSLMLYLYAAIILSFVGALHWGHAMHRQELGPGWLLWSVIPALVGWSALAFPMLAAFTRRIDQASILLLILAFLAQLFADVRIRKKLPRDVFPDWFMRMRVHLTLAACASLSVALFIR